MKLFPKILALSGAFVISTGLVVYGFMSAPVSANNPPPATEDQPVAPAPTQETSQTVTVAKDVSVLPVENGYGSTIETTGTVSSLTLVNVFSAAPGMVAKVNAASGQLVKAGDVLLEITGAQGNTHPYLSQLQLAQKNYDSAQKNYSITQGANASSLKSAELQLDSAKHQAEGAMLDLQGMDVNLNGIKNGELLIRDSFDHTRVNNDITRSSTEDSVDQLVDSIDHLENQKTAAENQLEDMDTIDTPEEQAQADALKKGIDELNTTLEDLYSKVDAAHNGYENLQEGQTLGENQVLGQLSQNLTQGEALFLTKQSTEAKLGLQDGTTDMVRAAEEGVNATKLRNEASTNQVKTAVDAAAINLQMAQAQADTLKVKATIDGTLENFNVHAGDLVSQQAPIASILDTQAFELKTYVDADTAQRIDMKKNAQVKIGGRWVPVKITHVADAADPMSKLIQITVQLPRISLKANQVMSVQLPLIYTSVDTESKSVFIPLDALIVGTEEQYVYVNENGTARKRVVKTGTISGDRVEILEGLSGSDSVIVQGARDLTDGDSVTVL